MWLALALAAALLQVLRKRVRESALGAVVMLVGMALLALAG